MTEGKRVLLSYFDTDIIRVICAMDIYRKIDIGRCSVPIKVRVRLLKRKILRVYP
jgi:hypothetical protein